MGATELQNAGRLNPDSRTVQDVPNVLKTTRQPVNRASIARTLDSRDGLAAATARLTG